MKKEKLTLMFKDHKVLSFEVDYEEQTVRILEKLEYYDYPHYWLYRDNKDVERGLRRFFTIREIPPTRYDFKEILAATNSSSAFELSFKGHGLSLSNHYWFKREGENLKYDDINFFTNKWDDSFARAVLSHDYEALKHCDLNVPDIVTPGWGVKGWIYDNGPKLYKLGIAEDHSEEPIAEALASRLASRLFKKGEYLEYELREFNGQYASVCSPMIGINEELIPVSNILSDELYSIYHDKRLDKKMAKLFFEKLKECGEEGLYDFFVKTTCLRDLGFVNDLHFENISMIRDINTGETRVAPLYDLGSAFGSSRSARELIEKPTKSTFFIIYFLYSDLDPDWDYSWYDPKKLIGFEEEIDEYLAKSSFYRPEILKYVHDIYRHQKETLDEYASKKH